MVQRQQQGESTLWPLLALLKAQEELAGRKTVVFFSTGLRVPPSLDGLFRTAIGQANRASVSVYAVDVRGLDTTRDLAGTAAALRQAAAASVLQNTRRDGAITRDEVATFDTAEDALRSNASGTLRDLAESTGGLLIANSNDLGRRLEQVASDLRLYYEVSYAPVRADYDGRFRRITVKVARKGVSVQARSGYFALPPGGATLFPYEVPLLGALSTRPDAHDFELRAGVSFAEEGTPTVAVEVPLDGLPFAMDPKGKTYRLGLSILAVVKSPDGEVRERFSDDYPMTGPADKLEPLRAKSAVLRRRLSVAPGDYVLETVALEKESDRASVGRWRFTVAATGGGDTGVGEATLQPDARRPRPAAADRPPAAAVPSRGSLGSFRSVVARYRAGEVAASVEARRGVPAERAAAEVERLGRTRTSAPRPGSDADWADAEVQAAALLSLDIAVEEARRGDAVNARRELDTGERLAGLVFDPARRARFHREWALGAAAFYRSRYEAGTALAILERASAAAGDDMELLFARAVIHETLGSRPFSGSGAARLSAAEAGDAALVHLPRAEELYRLVLASAPGRIEARLRLGRTLLLMGRPQEALAEIERVLSGRASPSDALLARLFAGVALEAEGRDADALARFEDARALDPRSRVAAMACARLLARTDRPAEARARAADVVGRAEEPTSADDPWLRYRLGGFGEDAAFDAQMARLRDEVRR
jgi:tetratricopeptide (TPR) repeat protein